MSAQAAPAQRSTRDHFWSSVREALRGSHGDFTEGAVSRAILLLAVPMVLEMCMESVFAVCDVFFVSKLGANATATVGLTESWLVLIYALAMGLSIAATATVARRIGERDRDSAARAAMQAILLSLAAAVALGIVGGAMAPGLLRVMGASDEVVRTGSPYARIMLGGNVSIVMLFVVNAIFRGAGDAVIAMRVLWLANGINVLLGPCLIFGLGPFPRLGVAGAAIATTIGRSTGAIVATNRLLRPGSRVDVHRRHLRVELALIRQMATMAWNAAIQFLIGMGSWIAIIRLLATFGSAVLAGYTIGIRVILFALLPASGLANAAATMVGQALGAGKPERAERSVRLAGKYNMIVLTVCGALLGAFAPLIARAFTHDTAVIPSATNALRIIACGFPFYGWGMVISQSLNGAGDTSTPTWLNVFVFWLWEIPLAWAARQLGFGPTGIYVVLAIAFSTYAVAAWVVFRRGKWKVKRV
jgi:putative MATE family efflux protein